MSAAVEFPSRRQRLVADLRARLVPARRVVHPSLLNCPHCPSLDVAVLVRDGVQYAVRCNRCGVVRALDEQGRRRPLPSAPALLRGVRLDG